MPRTPASATFYAATSYSTEESVGFLMKRVLASIVREVDLMLEPYGMTHAQWQPLAKLRESRKPMAVAELARELQIDNGGMTRLLDRLERKGFCKRVRSTQDRRVVMVEPTPAGALVPAVLSDVLNAHLTGFSEREWRALTHSLRRMLENGEAMHKSAANERVRTVENVAPQASKDDVPA